MSLATVSPQLNTRPPKLKITGVDCHVLLAPDFDPSFTSSAQDSLLVVIHTDGGVSGVGECDANPWMAKACIEAPGTHTMGLSIKEMLMQEVSKRRLTQWIGPESFAITSTSTSRQIQLYYEREVEVLPGFKKVFKFNVTADQPLI